MQEIRDELRKISRDVADIKINVAVNTVSLEHHIARSDASERRIEKIEHLLMGLAVVGILGGLIKLLVS
jgi:hypothetical protein